MNRIFKFSEINFEDCEQCYKKGLYATKKNAVSIWHFSSGQELPLHKHTTGDDIWIVIAGEGEYLWSEQEDLENTYEPNPKKVVLPPEKVYIKCNKRKIGKNTIIVNEAGVFHGLRNNSSEQLVIVSIEGPLPIGGLYTSR